MEVYWEKLCLYLFVLLYRLQLLIDATCDSFPSSLRQTWEYTYGNDAATLTFGQTTMTGLSYMARGSTISDYTCITKSNDIYILKSDSTYSDGGQNRNLYLCMRITKVTDNLFYFYLLADIDTIVTDNNRVLNLPESSEAPEAACNYCSYNTAPPDSDIHVLKKSGTSESLPGGETVCLPCTTASCDSSGGSNGDGGLTNGEKAAIGVCVTAAGVAATVGVLGAVYKFYGKNKGTINSKENGEIHKENISPENDIPDPLVEDSRNS